MLTSESKLSAAGSFPSRPLPLESGEFMHSREFLRRYERMPQLKQAELVEGVIHMGSPVSVRQAKLGALVQGWLVAYARRQPEPEVHTNATVILESVAPFRCQKVGGTRFSPSRRKPPASGVRSPYSLAAPAVSLTHFWKRER